MRILIFISIQYQFNLHDQFFLVFSKTKLLMINLKMVYCGAFYAPSYHICSELKEKTMKDIELFKQFFLINLSFCVDIYFFS